MSLWKTAPHHGDHSCPAGGGACKRTAAAGAIMCRDCWERVPGGLKNEVATTWAEWRDNFGDREFLKAYEAARDAAVAAVVVVPR